MHCGPVLDRIGPFWVVSDSFHVVFSAVSGRLWVVLSRRNNSVLLETTQRRPGSSVVRVV